MSFHAFRTIQPLCLFAVLLASQSSVFAQEPSQSLYERRMGLIKGTSPGIVIYDPEKSQPPATPATPATTGTPATPAPSSAKSETDSKSADPAVSQAPAKPGALSMRQLPSGRSLRDASHLGAVDGGIPVPTGR